MCTINGNMHHLCIEEEIPQPKKGEVLVHVRASSLNYRDLALIHGHYTLPSEEGNIPLSDAAGEVVAIGDGVTRLKLETE